MMKVLLFFYCFCILLPAGAQRTYAPHSVLATGNWFKVAVSQPGIYKMDIAFLMALGLNVNGATSSSIRVFGNGGAMLPESNTISRLDDLQENAIMVMDGGDGTFNGNDYVLFYANGPHHWQKDSINRQFIHQKNLYSEQSYYYISVQGSGKRIESANNLGGAAINIESYDFRHFYEFDSVNFLGSGKDWFGEDFSDAPGKTVFRQFPVPVSNRLPAQPVNLVSNLVSRSTGSASSFDIRINGLSVQQVNIPAVGTAINDVFARQQEVTTGALIAADTISIQYNYSPASFNAQGWLNWFRVFARANISMPTNGQLLFRDWQSVGHSRGNFRIANASDNIMVWNITDFANPFNMVGEKQGNIFQFDADCRELKEYVAFYPNQTFTPIAIGRVPNQDLHNISATDYLLVTHITLISQAERLASFHQQENNLRTRVVSTDQVFNEFSSGTPDPVAIRDFIKMYFDKAGELGDTVKYLLLFGDASFDYKHRLLNNTNLVPAYQSSNSLDPLSTYVSDDFFGFLNDDEDINSGLRINMLDVGIGRIPAATLEQAKNYVDKVIAYNDAQSLGPWRNQLSFIADDEDQNLHLNDAEIITKTATETNELFNPVKIYLDAYRQESSPGGSAYPQVNDAINNQVYNGTLIWNYNGHGGPFRLAEETVLDQQSVNAWQNAYRLPLFITATCDFAPFDNPTIASLGENILLRPETGGIALMTTTRVVFAYSNRIMNDNYIKFALEPKQGKDYLSLGEAVRAAKNYTYQTSGDVTNNRKFTLLGDPALTLAFPKLNTQITSINGLDPAVKPDTLKATDKVTMDGVVTDQAGNVLNSFNGTVYPTVFDKDQTVYTLANDPGSQVVGFNTRQNILYKGKASVINGRYTFSFKMPKDIRYNFGNGRISLYADDGSEDANGLENRVIIGGIGNQANDDKEGPEIKAYLNDDRFVDGGLVNAQPILIVKLADSSGINTAGTGIGHDIIATLDEDTRRFFVLNEFYESALDSYQEGSIKFQLPELEAGPHTLKVKAWDVMNNSNETNIHFIVGKEEELELKHVLNYPNPFSTRTQFWFTHNQPGLDLKVTLQIFTMSGRLIKSLKSTINTPGNRSFELEWDARDEFGDKVGRGVYFYKLRVVSGVHHKEVIEKLFIF